MPEPVVEVEVGEEGVTAAATALAASAALSPIDDLRVGSCTCLPDMYMKREACSPWAVVGKVEIPPGLAALAEEKEVLRPGSWTCLPVEPMKRRSCQLDMLMMSR